MPLINNITNIEVSNDINGTNSLKLYIFKEKLIQLLLISKNTWDIINTNKDINNIYELFTISFSETNIQLEIRSTGGNFEGAKKILNKIFIQKSNIYENYENGFVSFNVVGYNLNGIWYSVSEYYKNENYNKISIISGFKGNVITKPNIKKIIFKLKYVSQQTSSINIKNLIYFSNKRFIFGYTNDTKNEMKCFPLIRPFLDITVTSEMSNGVSQLIYFENDTTFKIPAVAFNQKILIKNISTISMRISSNIGENLKFKISTVDSLYNLDYYILKFNVLGIIFVTNRSLNNIETDQSDNVILINKFTNKDIDASNNILNWGNELPLHTNHSYLEQRIVGITTTELNNFVYKDLNYKLLVINKNSTKLDIFIQNNSSLAVKQLLRNTSNFGKTDLSNNIIQIIPKVKDDSVGSAYIGYTIQESNYEIFENLIIPDTKVDIAEVNNNIEKVLINLNLNSGLDVTYSSDINISVSNNYYEKIEIRDKGNEISGKNPFISIIKQLLILQYKVYIVGNDIKFERLNVNDNSILDLSGGTFNLSGGNPIFNVLENETLHFDVSDISNKGTKIKFFKDAVYQDELLDFSSNNFSYATYSRNFEPGEDGAFVKIETPSKNSQITDSKIYYSLIKPNYFNNQIPIGGIIQIEGRKKLNHGEMNVTPITKKNDGKLSYSKNVFYDPLLIKPIIDISLNINDATVFNYFNNQQYENIDISGQIVISSANVKTFAGDNIVCFNETIEKYYYKFFFRNENLIHGKIKIGFSTIYNSDLFTTKQPELTINNNEYGAVPNINNNENTADKILDTESGIDKPRYLKKIPFDLSNVELNGVTNYKNDTDYVVYTTKNFDANMNKTDFLIKCTPENGNSVYSNFFTGDLSDCSQNIFLAGDISNSNIYSCLVIIKEDLFGISRFEKIPNSDSNIVNTANVTAISILTNYKSSQTIPQDISLNVAFVRKKFKFIADISNANTVDSVFLFEPLDYSNNILNHDLLYNEYVVGMFDGDKISMCKIKLTQTEPFYTNTFDSSIEVSNSILTSKWASSTFGLFETKPRDLVSKYKTEFDDLTNRGNGVEVKNFKLPLFDSNKCNDFTVEVEYFECWKNNPNSKITYRINKKNKNITEGYDIISTLVYPESNENFQNLLFKENYINIDVSGIISIGDVNSVESIGEYLGSKARKYKVTYQIDNYLTNDIINEIKTNQLYNLGLFKTLNGKTILNINYLNTPLKFDGDISFNVTNPTGQIINTVVNKQNSIKLDNLKYQDTDISGQILTKIGIGYINYTTEEIINGAYDPSGAFSGLSGKKIYFNVIDVDTITDLTSVVREEKNIRLEWKFRNTNLSVVEKFNIYRSQNPTTKEYILIASTSNRYYYDSRSIPYLQANYKVESIIEWEGVQLLTGSEETDIFICENNTFEYGRYNNTKKNKKLFQPLNTSCQKMGMSGIPTTGNLFPNSNVLTKAQIYTTLSRAKFRPFR
tara:strand:- start:746 stop:5140 length:4395 start_codon:yes stop_codon:yes gene_type:complete